MSAQRGAARDLLSGFGLALGAFALLIIGGALFILLPDVARHLIFAAVALILVTVDLALGAWRRDSFWFAFWCILLAWNGTLLVIDLVQR